MKANVFTKKIEMSATEAKAAGRITTDEYKELVKLKQLFPSFEIQVMKRNTKKAKDYFKGLDYDYMKAYIDACKREDKDEIIEEFSLLMTEKNEDTGKKVCSYIHVKKWFLATFPEIEQSREERNQKIQSILNKVAA